jgi:hypothetical protein
MVSGIDKQRSEPYIFRDSVTVIGSSSCIRPI